MIDLVLVALPNPALTNPTMYFPLGILYIAASTKKAGHSVEIMDLRDGRMPDTFPCAEFYGFSCTTPEIIWAREIAQRVKPAKTIIGGAHASLLPSDCLSFFDYIVIGEGEYTILDILDDTYAPGILRPRRITDLDRLPFPAWDLADNPFSEELFPGERYGTGEKAATLIASRGCPFSCAFCGNLFRNLVTCRTTDNILAELKELIKRGVRYFRFEDDNFTLLPDFKYLCRGLKKLNIRYKCHTRSDRLTLEWAQWMKESGCEECGLGVESSDPEVLRINNKKETVEQHSEAVRILRQAGLRSKTYFIAGLPGETDDTIELNKEFFIKYKPDKWTLSTFTPYPGCDIYNHPEKYGIQITQPDWSRWWNFNQGGYNHIIEGQTQEQMWQRYLDFYDWLVREEWK